MIRQRGESFVVAIYDAGNKGKRWIGTYGTRAEAEHAEVEAKRGQYVAPTREVPDVPDQPTVYFVLAPEVGLVKIGFTRRLGMRFSAMSTDCPVELRLLAHIDGSQRLEKQLHHRFRLYRVRGEWFRVPGDLAAYLEAA